MHTSRAESENAVPTILNRLQFMRSSKANHIQRFQHQLKLRGYRNLFQITGNLSHTSGRYKLITKEIAIISDSLK